MNAIGELPDHTATKSPDALLRSRSYDTKTKIQVDVANDDDDDDDDELALLRELEVCCRVFILIYATIILKTMFVMLTGGSVGNGR